MSTRSIVHIPHPSLRQKARAVFEVSPEIQQSADSLLQTLANARKPRGVGLAATQIDVNWRMFATLLDNQLRLFINPSISDHANTLVLGKDVTDPDLEGCLSIPKLYGPVPRFPWISLDYQEIHDGKLVNKSERFEDFPARVIQHERDHLDGILFIDYSLQYELPVFENVDTLTPVPMEIVETLVNKSRLNPEPK